MGASLRSKSAWQDARQDARQDAHPHEQRAGAGGLPAGSHEPSRKIP
jgi:hypothetical protein